MARRPTPIPVKHLKPLPAAAGSLELGNRHLRLSVSALSPEVLRLRIHRAGNAASSPAWAIMPTEPVVGIARTRIRGDRASLQTRAGQLQFNLRTGACRVVDCHGLEVFSIPSGTMSLGAETGGGLELGLAEGERLFGFGETTGPLDQRGRRRELWNIDVLGHAPAIHPGLRSLYVSIPLMISLREGRAAAVFWDNPARQVWDLEHGGPGRCRVTVDHGGIDLVLFLGPTLPGILEHYTALTGRMPLPPRWALGYHQCRYSYETADRLEEVAAEFRRRGLPCDALYLDIHHLRGYRVFTFGRTFPKPAELLSRLRRQGFKVIPIVDPGVKCDPRFGVFQRGRKHDAFVKGPDGTTDFPGRVWPGDSCWPDFLDAGVREWWGREQAALFRLGVAGIWNDMNEPANFARPDKTLDPDCRHRTEHGPRRHVEVHNLYGQQMARASREGALAACPDQRPFVVSRAGWAGIQRHAAVWTGDNSSSWEHLADSLRCLLNLGLSGVPFCGSDVGGFLDNCPDELLVRWTQMAALTPFFRNHSNVGTRDQEPWSRGEPVETLCRRALTLRYQLLPYLYGLFHEAARTGAPIMRPLAWHFQNEPEAVACGDQFLLGPSLLVAPILAQGASARSVYLPPGNWFDFWSGEVHRGRQQIVVRAPLDTLPLFVRAGAVIPFAVGRQFVGPQEPEEIVLHIWPGAPGSFQWYEDDGASLAHERGIRSERGLHHEATLRGGRLILTPTSGPFPSEVRHWRIVLRDRHREPRVRFRGKPVAVDFLPELRIASFLLKNEPGPLRLSWS
ncbi:MAG: DUF5110 domain-containing protein [Verrucomicrobiales bacterium]|nr:DUF5110 domain-containing protein [Verrucomicrobiales bacterium]